MNGFADERRELEGRLACARDDETRGEAGTGDAAPARAASDVSPASDPGSCTDAFGASEVVRGDRGSPRDTTRNASLMSVFRPRSLARLDGRESLSLSLSLSRPASFIDTLIRRAILPHGSSLSFELRFSSLAGASTSTFVQSSPFGAPSCSAPSARPAPSASSSVIAGVSGDRPMSPAISPKTSRSSSGSPG